MCKNLDDMLNQDYDEMKYLNDLIFKDREKMAVYRREAQTFDPFLDYDSLLTNMFCFYVDKKRILDKGSTHNDIEGIFGDMIDIGISKECIKFYNSIWRLIQ